MHMRDEIDEEVKKLLEDMERKCDLAAVLNGAEDSVAQALRDVGELHERARQGVRHAICALATHYDDLKDYPEYHKVATTLAGLDMILTPGFRLIIRAETERKVQSFSVAVGDSGAANLPARNLRFASLKGCRPGSCYTLTKTMNESEEWTIL